MDRTNTRRRTLILSAFGVAGLGSVAACTADVTSGNAPPALASDGGGSADGTAAADGGSLVDSAANGDDAANDGGTNPGLKPCGVTLRASVASDGTEGNGESSSPQLSADGRFVAFLSMASNLAPNDTNGLSDVFVHDLASGSTEIVSVASDGGVGNGAATAFSISSDGRFVTFLSTANNLVAGDSNAAPDVFVRDRKTGTTERVSLTAAGAEGPGAGSLLGTEISADGRFVLFSGRDGYVPNDTNGFVDLFVRDRVAGTTVLVGTGAAPSNEAPIEAHLSANGQFVVFLSRATTLIVPPPQFIVRDRDNVFVAPRTGGGVQLASRQFGGASTSFIASGPKISPDGRTVMFHAAGGSGPNATLDADGGAAYLFSYDQPSATLTSLPALNPQRPDRFAVAWGPRVIAFLTGLRLDPVRDTEADTDDVYTYGMSPSAFHLTTRGLNGQAVGTVLGFTITPDGAAAAFTAVSANYVTNDKNNVKDVYVTRADCADGR